jgi:signal transduction histidine kinase
MRPRLGLRARFFLYSNSVILVTVAIVTIIAIVHERRAHRRAILERGRSMAEVLAIGITDAMMYEELGLVVEAGLTENYIADVLERNADLVRYVIVTDKAGRVIHSNRWELLGESFARALDPSAIGAPPETELRNRNGEPLLEVRVPLAISTRFWGSLTLALSLDEIRERVNALFGQAALLALGLILVNSLLTGIYVETLIRPIIALNKTMKRAGGGNFTVRARAHRRDEVGELAGAFNRMMDELEEARDLEAMRQSQLAHTEKMAAVGTLAAGVAHEVNNPLTGILACIENMREDPDNADKRQRYLDLIEHGLQRIERTVTLLLDFARPRKPRAELTPLNHNVRHVSELIDYQARKAQVEVKLELDPAEPVVMADHFQMEQVFLNLALNAIQAMKGGGELLLRTRVRRDEVLAEVEDTGEGISPDLRDRIFDPFFTTRNVGEGTGLGLAVTDTIVAAHGGSIEVHSVVGTGTTFRVRLPRAQRKAA